MKPINLEFCGVNSFSEPAAIDFEVLSQSGIFGIFGDTGSGKSTVLDCISFALYGDVARSKGSLADIVNYRLDRATVKFSFEIFHGGVRKTFLIERELKRKNAVQSVKLYECDGSGQHALCEGVRESNARIIEIVGLEQKDFEKCIALPQGEFAQFVKAPRGERLKLVSRLFNLDRYGEGLSKRASARFARLREEKSVAEARLEPFKEFSEEGIRALEEQIKLAQESEKAERAALESAREEEKRLVACFEKCRERDGLLVNMQSLEDRKAEMKALDEATARLEKAASALVCEKEYNDLREKKRLAFEELGRSAAQRDLAEREAQAASAFDDKACESEIVRLTALLAECKSAAFAKREYEAGARRLNALRAERGEEQKKLVGFSYEDERRRLEEEERALGGDGDFLSYLETHGKAGLFRGEYATFVREIAALNEKYPEIEKDGAPLVAKYEALANGDPTDFKRLRADYENRKRERERLTKLRVSLEQRRSAYDLHLNALKTLSEEEDRLLARAEELKPLFEGKESEEHATLALEKKRREKSEAERIRRAADDMRVNAALAHTVAAERNAAAASAEESAFKRLNDALQAGAFESAAQAATLLRDYGDAEVAKKRVEEYKERYAAVRSRLRQLLKETTEEVDRARIEEATRRLKEREERAKENAGALAVLRNRLKTAEQSLERKKALEAEYQSTCAEFTLFERLKKLLDGNKFMEYVAEEYLQTVALAAGRRLSTLTGGRYSLHYDGGFFVGDNYDGGNKRSVSTLSGGETFLVSLSLAVALSAEICARSLKPFEFFFLDEGFGTLDEKLVDVVVDSLEKLKGKNLTVGIISHVEELKHRIESKLTVYKATERQGSKVVME